MSIAEIRTKGPTTCATRTARKYLGAGFVEPARRRGDAQRVAVGDRPAQQIEQCAVMLAFLMPAEVRSSFMMPLPKPGQPDLSGKRRLESTSSRDVPAREL
jgi:hypothetical protein